MDSLKNELDIIQKTTAVISNKIVYVDKLKDLTVQKLEDDRDPERTSLEQRNHLLENQLEILARKQSETNQLLN